MLCVCLCAELCLVGGPERLSKTYVLHTHTHTHTHTLTLHVYQCTTSHSQILVQYGKEHGFGNDIVTVIAGLSNTYADYVVTFEEYQVPNLSPSLSLSISLAVSN